MPMRAVDLFKKSVQSYRESINPPYKRRDFLIIGITILVLLSVPLTVILGIQARDLRSRAVVPSQTDLAGTLEIMVEEDESLENVTLAYKLRTGKNDFYTL